MSTLFSWPQWQHTVVSWPLLISLYGSLGVGRAAADPETETATNRLPARIQLTLVDDQTIHYATFQSHNQKVVEHEGQVYMTHLRACNAEYTDQLWRLSRSRDGGARFETLCEESAATNPPLLEVDELGNLYLLRVDFVSHDAYLDRWPRGAADRAQTRSTTRIPNAAAGKYAAMIDPNRQLIYFFSHNNTFHRLRLDGTLVDSRNLLTAGPHGLLQYPLLSLDPHGKLHLAWTTQKHGEYLYWDIHHAWSDDGGQTFRSWSTSASEPADELTLPIIADDTGPTLRISQDDEFEVHSWLSSSLATRDHWHGLYLAQSNPPRQHYVRYRLSTGQRELDRQPTLMGQSIRLQGLDGFLVADRRRSERIYVVGNDNGHLACLVSDDAGSTWRDYARSEQRFGLYSIGGFRWTSSDDAVLGSFTHQNSPQAITDRQSQVYFFRISANQ